MRRWKAASSARIWFAVALLIAAFGSATYFLVQLGRALAAPPEAWPIGLPFFAQLLGAVFSLLLAGILAYRVGAAFTLTYSVDRNGAYIFWLGNRAVIPLAQIETIEGGLHLPQRLIDRLNSVGYYHGRSRLPSGRTVHRFSTVPPAQALVLHTATEAYAISPADADAFVQELEQRRRLGAIQQLSPGIEAGRIFFYPFWNDRVVRGFLIAAFVLNLAVLGWLMAIYPNLPELIAVRTDAAGADAALEPRHQVLFLPLAATVVSLLNLGLGLTLYAREPIGARMLQVASVVAQILFAVAVLTIVR
jgi:hypothetical protein